VIAPPPSPPIQEVDRPLAKRTRGSRRDRRRAARQGSFAPPAPRAATEPLVAGGEAPSAVPPAPGAAPAPLPTSRVHAAGIAPRPSVLSVKAVEEYRYVTLDLRRIVVVVGGLFATMLALWVAVDVLKVVTI
jgi:hypothetical protein